MAEPSLPVRPPRELGSASALLTARVDQLFKALKAAYGMCYEPAVSSAVEVMQSAYYDLRFLEAVDTCYEVVNEAHGGALVPCIRAKGGKMGVKLGMVESLDSLSDALSHVLPMKAITSLYDDIIDEFKTDVEDVLTAELGDVLLKFSRFYKIVEEAPCHDNMWLITVAAMLTVQSFIRTELPIDQWPCHLARAFEYKETMDAEQLHEGKHYRWLENGDFFMAYSVPDGGKKSDFFFKIFTEDLRLWMRAVLIRLIKAADPNYEFELGDGAL